MMTKPQTTAINNAAIRRMEWRCRRGMLEMDLLFVDFVSHYLPSLNQAQIAALDQLLDLPDNELWNFVSGADDSVDAAALEVLTMLRGNK